MDTVVTYFIVGLSAFFPRFPGTSVSATFPYTTVSSGVTTAGTFTGSMGPGSYPHVMYMADLYGLGFFSKRQGIEIGLAMNREWANNWGFTAEGRYARIFHLRGWLLEPGASFLWLAGRNERMGSIDNNGDTVHVLGMTSGPQFSVPASKYSSGGTFNTDHLKVAYYRGNLLLAPVLTIARFRKKGPTVFWTAGWYFDVQQTSRLGLFQENSDESHSSRLGKVKLPHNGRLSGFFAGVRLGLRLPSGVKRNSARH
jgi:hypothetical protein